MSLEYESNESIKPLEIFFDRKAKNLILVVEAKN